MKLITARLIVVSSLFLAGFMTASTIVAATWLFSVSEHRRQAQEERLQALQQMSMSGHVWKEELELKAPSGEVHRVLHLHPL